MAIKLTNGVELRTPSAAFMNVATRKLFISFRVRAASGQGASINGAMLFSRVNTSTFQFKIENTTSDAFRVRCQSRPSGGSGNAWVWLPCDLVNHIVLVYDADDPTAQGTYANSVFYPNDATQSGNIGPTANALLMGTGNGGEIEIEDVIVGRGVIPTMAQVHALGGASSPAEAAALLALSGVPDATITRWTLRGTPESAAATGADAGTADANDGNRFSLHAGNNVYYAEDMPYGDVTIFGQPTVMSSGKAIEIPIVLDVEGVNVHATVASVTPDVSGTFKINGGSPITPDHIVGTTGDHDALFCVLPDGTAVGPDDVVTWNAPAGWIRTTFGGTPEVADALVRNRVGQSMFDLPEGTTPLRVGCNFTIPGPAYYAPHQLVKNRAKHMQMNISAAARRDDGTFKGPASGLRVEQTATGTRVDKVGYPLRLGHRLLAWTDHGESTDNADLPCNWTLASSAPRPKVTLLSEFNVDEPQPDGSVRKARLYDVALDVRPVELTAAIDDAATTIPLDSVWTHGLSGEDFHLVLELDGETIVATSSAIDGSNPRLLNCKRGVKGTAKSHSLGAAGSLRATQLGGVISLNLSGTAGKINYSDLMYLGPGDWEPGPGGAIPSPIPNPGPLELSHEFETQAAEGLGVVRFMDTTGTQRYDFAVVEPEQIHDVDEATWNDDKNPGQAVFDSVRQFTPGEGKWCYLRIAFPGTQTYPVTLDAPLSAVAAGTKETISATGSESNPIMVGTRLLNGSERIRVISGSGSTWTVERGAELTTPESRSAGSIDAGWRLPIATGGGSGASFEIVTAEPHSLVTGTKYAGQKSNAPMSLWQGELTDDIDGSTTTLPVAFDSEAWDWLAPGLTVAFGGETAIIASVNESTGEIEVDKRTNGQPRLTGVKVNTRCVGVLCESSDASTRYWQPVLDFAYNLRVTGPNSFALGRSVKEGTTENVVVPGQSLAGITYVNAGVAAETFPYEVTAAAANHAGGWLWFNIPGFATDAHVVEAARRIRNTLNPGRKVVVELANEIWNNKFQPSSSY